MFSRNIIDVVDLRARPGINKLNIFTLKKNFLICHVIKAFKWFHEFFGIRSSVMCLI